MKFKKKKPFNSDGYVTPDINSDDFFIQPCFHHNKNFFWIYLLNFANFGHEFYLNMCTSAWKFVEKNQLEIAFETKWTQFNSN